MSFSDSKFLIEKLSIAEAERDQHFEHLLLYREWFMANEHLLKDIPTTAPPYTKKDERRILRLIHAKYCPHRLDE